MQVETCDRDAPNTGEALQAWRKIHPDRPLNKGKTTRICDKVSVEILQEDIIRHHAYDENSLWLRNWAVKNNLTPYEYFRVRYGSSQIYAKTIGSEPKKLGKAAYEPVPKGEEYQPLVGADIITTEATYRAILKGVLFGMSLELPMPIWACKLD